MSAPKFTAGPWGISRYASTYVVANERGICSTGGYSNNMVDQELLTAENEANARLIAAAPELYEALDALSLVVGLTAFKHEGQRAPLQDAVDAARAALAKARGESNG